MSSKLLRFAFAAVLFAAPALSNADDGPRFRLEVDGDDGERVRLELAAGWLGALVRHVDLECDGSDDRQTLAMARALDRSGEGAVHEFVDRDGDEVVARRSRGQLLLETRHRDGEQAVVEMPWQLAECVLLGREPKGGFSRWLANEGLSLRVETRDGERRVRFSFD